MAKVIIHATICRYSQAPGHSNHTPILIGEGIRLFDNLKSGDAELERIDLVATERITSLRFRVIKS
jgi:hypothetical protein